MEKMGGSKGGALLSTISSAVLRSALVLVASTACLQVAFGNQGPAESKAAVESVDSGSKISSTQARQLRLRSLTVEPGGVVELHPVKDRSTVLHVIRGTLVSHPYGVVLRPGVGLTQDQDVDFWIGNAGSEPAEFIWLPLINPRPR